MFRSFLLNQGPLALCLLQHCLFRQTEEASSQHAEFSALTNGLQDKYITHLHSHSLERHMHQNAVALTNYEGWNFNSGNYLFTTDTK